jgi:prepilin signal peptidase PulO-like enzyme (type II secretory pathway)
MPSVLFAQTLAEPGTPRYWYLLAMLTVLGGVVGSFINVVVYRLPAGMSLSRPGSRCPRCGAKIRWLDNIPVLGWLKLRGRCRNCREAISSRYPIIELLTALMFLGLAWVEPLADARNLPDRLGFVASGESQFLLGWSDWQLWAVYAYQLFLLCGLECAMLLEYDGHGIAKRLTLPVWLVGLAAPLASVQLRPVAAFQAIVDQLESQTMLLSLVDGLAGLAVGLVLGMLASPIAQLGPSGRQGVRTLLFASTSTGLYLGWQAGSMLMVFAAVVFAAITVYRPAWRRLERVPFAGLLWIGSLAWIVGWRWIVGHDVRMAAGASGELLAASGAIVLLASCLGWWAARIRSRGAAKRQQPG